MSRKKSLSDKIICENIEKLRKKTGLSGVMFAKKIGISQSYLSELENYKAKPNKTLLLAVSHIYNISMDWLLTGEGEMTRKGTECATFIYKEGSDHRVSDSRIEYEPETIELLAMTGEIIRSGTSYAYSLAANIRSFHQAMQTEKRLNKMEDEVVALKNKFTDLDERTERRNIEKDHKIRYYDPLEKKEELIKMRTMSSM